MRLAEQSWELDDQASDLREKQAGKPGMSPGVDEEEFHLLDLLTVLARRRRQIGWITGVIVLVTTVAVFVLPSSYKAETVVMPPQQNSSISSALAGQLGGSAALASMAGSSLGLKNPGDLYVSLLKSRTVEDAMISRFHLLDRYQKKRLSDARDALEKHASIALGAKDGMISIDVTDRDPVMAATMANAYVEEYRHLSAHLAITEAARRREFFEQQLLEANENLTRAEDALKQVEQKTGVLQLDSQTRALIETAATLRAQIVSMEVQLQGLMSYSTEDNPQVRELKGQIEAMQGQLARLVGSDSGGSSFLIPKGKVPEVGLEYIRKVRDVKYYETMVTLMAQQFEMAKVDEARQGTSLQVVDAAIPPDHRSFPKRGISIVVAAILGFLLACGWSILAESLNRISQAPSELARLELLKKALQS